MSNKIYLETDKNVDSFGRLFNKSGKANIPVPEGGSDVYLEGNSLVIPEQEWSEPVITIDEVDYYHKTEINVAALKEEAEATTGQFFKRSLVLSKEDVTVGCLCLACRYTSTDFGFEFGLSKSDAGADKLYPAPSDYNHILGLTSFIDGYALPATLYTVGPNVEVDVFNSVDTENVTAIYLQYDENADILNCYYNLKTDSAPEYVDSIKQGSEVIPLKDTRIPDSAVAEAGKVVKVGADGKLELGEAGGGTKLYKHVLSFNVAENNKIEIISTDSTALTASDLESGDKLSYCLSCKIKYKQSTYAPTLIYNIVGILYNNATENYLFTYFGFGKSDAGADNAQTNQLIKYAKSNFIGDTVTEL